MLSFLKRNVSHETLEQPAELTSGAQILGKPTTFTFTPLTYQEIGAKLHLRMPLSAVEQLKATEQELSIPVYVGMGAKLERAVIDYCLQVLGEMEYLELLPAFVGCWREDEAFSDQDDLLLGTVRQLYENGFQLGETAAFCGCSTFSVKTAYGSYPRHLISALQLGEEENTMMPHLRKLFGPEGLALPYQSDEDSLQLWLPSGERYISVAKVIWEPQEVGWNKSMRCIRSGWLAVDRVIAAILENGQQEDGTVLLPEAMMSYLSADRLK